MFKVKIPAVVTSCNLGINIYVNFVIWPEFNKKLLTYRNKPGEKDGEFLKRLLINNF